MHHRFGSACALIIWAQYSLYLFPELSRNNDELV